jgi:uncharacterized DUF497 family protein
MHPNDADGFEWDDGNESELARHQITFWEVEEVFLNNPIWAPNKKHRSGDWKMVGRTDSGRALTVIIRLQVAAGSLRAITGWDATKGEHTRYLEKMRGRR